MKKRSYEIASLFLMGTAMSGLALAGSPAYTPDLVPANPKAGECYARVAVPAQYRTDTQTVLVKEAHAELQVTEPQLRARQEHVMVKEASVYYKVRQPTYKTVTDQIMVRPGYDRLSVTRPQFQTVTETIQSSKPRLVWKKGNPATLRAEGYIVHSTADAGQGGRGYRSTREYGRTRSNATLCGPTCEIWCLVEAPGQTVSYNRKVMTSPGEVQRIAVPPKYSTITKQVVADRGGVEEIEIPAEFRAVTVEDVVTKAAVHKVSVPPKYGSVEKKTLISAERYEWRRVVCLPGSQSGVRPVAGRAYSLAAKSHSSAQTKITSHSRHRQSSHTSSTAAGSAVYERHQPRVYGGSGATQTPVTGLHQSQTFYHKDAAADTQAVHSEAVSTSAGAKYYGSDLPTYSEDYTKPAAQKTKRRGRIRYRTR